MWIWCGRSEPITSSTTRKRTSPEVRYDLMLDIAGSKSWRACRRVLKPQAILVIVGAPKGNRLMGPLSHVVRLRLASLRSSRKVVFFIAKLNKEDMMTLRELLDAGKVTPVIDKSFEFGQITDAFGYMGEGHARAKVVVSI